MRPHLEYGMPACLPNLMVDINNLGRIQRLASRLVSGIRHFPYEETAAAVPTFLVATTATGRPDYRIQDIHGSLEC